MKNQIFGFGNALVDYEITVSDTELEKLEIQKGLMTLVDEDRLKYLMEHVHGNVKARSCGGSAANTMITAQQLGFNGFYSCKVANDEVGEFFYNDLKSYGIGCNFDHQKREEGTTGKCMVLITPDAERSMETCLGITETVSEKELSFDDLKESNILYIEGYLVASPTGKAAAIKAREFCQENNIPVSLTFSDPNMVSFFRDGMKEIIGEKPIDLIFANEQEALTFTEKENLDEAVEELKKYAKTFVVTRSEKGSITYDGKNKEEVTGFPVEAMDTTGAGDTYAGAFLAARNQGKSFSQAARVANFAASHVVTKYGARLSPEQEVEVNIFMKTV